MGSQHTGSEAGGPDVPGHPGDSRITWTTIQNPKPRAQVMGSTVQTESRIREYPELGREGLGVTTKL